MVRKLVILLLSVMLVIAVVIISLHSSTDTGDTLASPRRTEVGDLLLPDAGNQAVRLLGRGYLFRNQDVRSNNSKKNKGDRYFEANSTYWSNNVKANGRYQGNKSTKRPKKESKKKYYNNNVDNTYLPKGKKGGKVSKKKYFGNNVDNSNYMTKKKNGGKVSKKKYYTDYVDDNTYTPKQKKGGRYSATNNNNGSKSKKNQKRYQPGYSNSPQGNNTQRSGGC